MSEHSDQFYSRWQLIDIANQHNIPEAYHEDFSSRFEKEVEIIANDEGFERDEIKDVAIDFTITYINKLMQQIEKGHSRLWAELYADNLEEHFHAFYDTYKFINDKDPELALKELKVHCKAAGGDELYEKQLIYLTENVGFSENVDQQAATYSEVYRHQKELGESDLFAHQYADCISDNMYNEAYCYIFAKRYETAINKGESEIDAWKYADEIASYYGDQYTLSKNICYDDSDIFNETSIVAKLKAGKYAYLNKVDNPELFIFIYKRIYLDYCFPDEKRPKLSEEELDKKVLEEALAKYHK